MDLSRILGTLWLSLSVKVDILDKTKSPLKPIWADSKYSAQSAMNKVDSLTQVKLRFCPSSSWWQDKYLSQIREEMSGPDLHVFTLKFLALCNFSVFKKFLINFLSASRVFAPQKVLPTNSSEWWPHSPIHPPQNYRIPSILLSFKKHFYSTLGSGINIWGRS